MKTLILGYGNPDRQDDGVAWAILYELATASGLTPPTMDEPLITDSTGHLTLMVALQLLPEMAELVSEHERVCFVDAHTGRVPDDLSIEKLGAEFQNSPFTHHLTPQSCLSMAESLYHKKPEGWLVSVRGFKFGFSHSLSTRTRDLAIQAAAFLSDWLKEIPGT